MGHAARAGTVVRRAGRQPKTWERREQDRGFGDVPDAPPRDAGQDDDDAPAPRVEWEVPEVAAAAVVLAVGLLVLGGLVAGIAAAAGAPTTFGPGSGAVETGSSIQVGAAWAEPLLAIVLLGVLGVCWWWIDAWSEAPSDTGGDEAARHIGRARAISGWVNGALALTLAGSVALLAGLLLTNSQAGNQSSLVWSRDISQAASVLAVAVIVSGGTWAGMRLRTVSDEGEPRIAD